MKAPEKVVFLFDPDKSDNLSLADSYGRILWACIKTNHITNQYFDDDVLRVAKRIRENNPKTYEEFRDIIQTGPLRVFGTTSTGPFLHHFGEDCEFWKGIWGYISGEKVLQIEIKEKVSQGEKNEDQTRICI